MALIEYNISLYVCYYELVCSVTDISNIPDYTEVPVDCRYGVNVVTRNHVGLAVTGKLGVITPALSALIKKRLFRRVEGQRIYTQNTSTHR